MISFFSYAAEHIIEEPYQGLVIALRLGPNLLCTSNAANEVQTLPAGTSSSVTYPSWLEIFNAARRTEPWSEGSVRNAWVLGIDKMCSSQSGLMWCLEKGAPNSRLVSLSLFIHLLKRFIHLLKGGGID